MQEIIELPTDGQLIKWARDNGLAHKIAPHLMLQNSIFTEKEITIVRQVYRCGVSAYQRRWANIPNGLNSMKRATMSSVSIREIVNQIFTAS